MLNVYYVSPSGWSFDEKNYSIPNFRTHFVKIYRLHEISKRFTKRRKVVFISWNGRFHQVDATYRPLSNHHFSPSALCYQLPLLRCTFLVNSYVIFLYSVRPLLSLTGPRGVFCPRVYSLRDFLDKSISCPVQLFTR